MKEFQQINLGGRYDIVLLPRKKWLYLPVSELGDDGDDDDDDDVNDDDDDDDDNNNNNNNIT